MAGKVSPQIGFEFLVTEIATGLLFATIALDAGPNEADKFFRNRQNAYEAYNAILRYQGRVDLDPRQAKQFTSRLQHFESVLLRLHGVAVSEVCKERLRLLDIWTDATSELAAATLKFAEAASKEQSDPASGFGVLFLRRASSDAHEAYKQHCIVHHCAGAVVR